MLPLNSFDSGGKGFETTCAFNFIDNSGKTPVLLSLALSEGLTITPDMARELNISGSNALLGL